MKDKKIERALISVSDKSGLLDLAAALSACKVEILSTGGTAGAMVAGGFSVTEVSLFTGFHEMLDGRVKTLHPKIHAGILYRRDSANHIAQMRAAGFEPIDLVVVNLYPFEETVAKPGIDFQEAIENIDIGGPCLVRAAAKNHDHVTVICDPADYPVVIGELRENGRTTLATRRMLAQKAFARISAYDAAISTYLTDK